MIITGDGHHGMTITLASGFEVASLGAILASGHAVDTSGYDLRTEILSAIGVKLFGNPQWALTLPAAWENAYTEHEMGISKLIRQAYALPAIRKESAALVNQCAARLGQLIDQAGPRPASVADMARRRDSKW